MTTLATAVETRRDFDIAICGAGPVGMTLAALLVQRGVPAPGIALIDSKTIAQAAKDPRSIALSYGSRQILERISAWPISSTAIREIHVSRRGHFGRTLIEADAYALPALGYVTRYGDLATALASSPLLSEVGMFRPMHVSSIAEQSDAVTIHLAEANNISAQIVVQAEGGVFGEQAAKPLSRGYEQTAVIAQVRCSEPLLQRAFERFTDEGPLALLPQDGSYSLVWCVRPETAERLLALSDSAFLHELELAFGSRLGRFIATSKRMAFPLGLNAHPNITSRTVAIGNAAQTLHPVAGQGLNLGLRDAAVLSRLLAQDSGSAALRQFAAARQADRSLTIRVTDVLARIFAAEPAGALSQTMLGLSLGLVDALKPAKRMLAEQMMFGRR